jgi:histidine ammonia-lyase
VTVVLDGRESFTLDAVRRVAWEGEDVRFSERAWAAMTRARESFMRLVNEDPTVFIYGVTTGYGEAAKTRLDAEGRRALAQRPPYGKRFGFGGRFPDRVVRAMILTRLTNYVEGNAAITPAVAQQVADMLDGRPLPEVPLYGQVGAGEVITLLNLFWHLHGVELAEKDGGCLINGSPISSALVADTALRARNRLRLAHRVLALSIEAIDAPLEAYDPALRALWGDEHETEALDALNALLAGARTEGRRFYQAPVSWRVVPRVLGQAHRALANAEEAAEIALRAVTDNPVYVLPDERHPLGRVFSTGGYHNGSAYPAIGWLAAAWADLCGLLSRQAMKLHRPDVSLLPAGLRADGSPFSTFGYAMAASWYGEAARDAASSTFLPPDESGSGQDDVALPTATAWIKEVRASEALDACLASLAVVASQAFHVTGREPAPPLRPFLAGVRSRVGPVVDLDDTGTEAEPLLAAFTEASVSGNVDLG